VACCGSGTVGSETAAGCCSWGVLESGSAWDWGIAVGETTVSPDGAVVAWRVGIGISSIACSKAEHPRAASKITVRKTIEKYFIHAA